MIKWILKFFSTKTLWREVIVREMPEVEDEVEAVTVWAEAFNKSPTLIDYLKRRQIRLLKSGTLGEKKSEFILGQIAENMLWVRFEPKTEVKQKVESEIVKQIPSEKDFLGRWNKHNATASQEKKENVNEGGVSRSEAQPSEDIG